MNAKERLLIKRPLKLIGFYIGYCNVFNPENLEGNGIFGSELCVVKLAETMAKKGYFVNVYVWNLKSVNMEKVVNGVSFLDATRLQEKHIEFDHFIINRYIHYFEYFKVNTKKLHIWVHDMIIQYTYKGKPISDEHGVEYTNAHLDQLDGIICLSEWHRQNMLAIYGGDIDKRITIIPHGINTDAKRYVYKKKNSFIYMSSAIRGLYTFLKCMEILQKIVPDVSITLFRKEEMEEKHFEIIKNLKNITVHERKSPDFVKQCLLETDFFFYPTHFKETFCCSALEAQLYQAICVYTDEGCLKTTIGDRGLLLSCHPLEDNFHNRAVKELLLLMNDEERKSAYREKGFEFAKTMSWENSLEYWEKNIF